MIKKIGALCLVTLCLVGCGKKANETEITTEQTTTVATTTTTVATTVATTTKKTTSATSNIQSKMAGEYWYSSGAGGWGSTIKLKADGSFTGEYFDSEMGTVGPGYENGTYYYCEFSGKFSTPVKVNDYTYEMKVTEVNIKNKGVDEEIIDGIKYIYTGASVGEGETYKVYTPDTKKSSLSDDVLMWLPYDEKQSTTLDRYGICAVDGNGCFFN